MFVTHTIQICVICTHFVHTLTHNMGPMHVKWRADHCITVVHNMCTTVNTCGGAHMVGSTSWVPPHVSTLLHDTYTTVMHESFLCKMSLTGITRPTLMTPAPNISVEKYHLPTIQHEWHHSCRPLVNALQLAHILRAFLSAF
jgi:hypothetical protein